MKPASVLLLCTAALLPAALNAQNVDVGIAWDPPLPDTVIMGTMVTPIVRATNHSAVPTSFLLVLNYMPVSQETVAVNNLPGESSAVVTFSPIPIWTSSEVLSYLVISGDTNPDNDTIRHEFYGRRPNVDVGVSWVPPLPDTVDLGFFFNPRLRVTNYTRPPVNGTAWVEMFDPCSTLFYAQCQPFSLGGLSSTTLSFPATGLLTGGNHALRGTVHVLDDTNPANDTAWWRPYVRGSGVAEEPQPQSVLSGLRALPTHFSGQVVIYCREPARLLIYNAAGNLVRTLAPARPAVWDGRDQRGLDLPACVYTICCGPGRSQTRVVKTR